MKVLEKGLFYYLIINNNFPIFLLEIIDDITQKNNDKKNDANIYDNDTISSKIKSIIEI